MTDIRWEKYPDGCTGVIGGRFVVPDASIRVQYADGSYMLIPLTAEMCSAVDMRKSGTQIVTVTYEDCSLLFSLTLTPRLSWICKPMHYEIGYGESLTITDATFIVCRDDGTSTVVTLTPDMCVGFDPYTYGQQTIEVPYAGEALTFSVTVGLEDVASLCVETLPAKRCYKVFRNTWPDVTGGTLRVTFTDGTAQIIPMSEATVRYTPKWAGTFSTVEPQTVYLDYGGQTTAYSIHNLGCPVTEVEEAVVTKLPNGLVFSVEEQWSIDLTGGRIYARTVDGAEGEEDMA